MKRKTRDWSERKLLVGMAKEFDSQQEASQSLGVSQKSLREWTKALVNNLDFSEVKMFSR